MDLYVVLGVGHTARRSTIVKAFRKLAMRHHPDRGGDRAEFERVELAYSVLSDPERRARYDANGDCDIMPTNDLAEIMGILGPCYMDVLGSIINQGRKPEQADLLVLMTTAIRNKINEIKTAMNPLKKRQEGLKALLGRWTATDKPNVMEQATKQMLEGLDGQIKAQEMIVGKMTTAIDFLKSFKFRKDAEEVPRMLIDTFGASTGFTQWRIQ